MIEDKRKYISKRKYNNTFVNGKFAEYLVMFQLMAYRGWDVEYVDHFGVDLIAIDTNVNPHKRYAIQVKMRHFYSDGMTNSNFTFQCEKNLRAFCDYLEIQENEFIPLVAYVNINRDQSINTFIINVNDLAEMGKEAALKNEKSGFNGIGYSNSKGGYICNSNSGLESLKVDPRVTHYVLSGFEKCERNLDNLGKNNDLSYLDDLKNSIKAEYTVDYKIDPNHNKHQMGDFGEWYFMMKAIASGYKALLVKSVGADIMLFTENDNGRAVSVKTFSKKENDGYTFEKTNAEKLRKFSEKWGMKKEPLVTLQQMIYRERGNGVKEYYKMYNFTMELSYLENTKTDYLKYSKSTSDGEKNGYRLNWSGDNLNKIQNDKNITVDIVVFDEPFVYDFIARERNSYTKIKNKLSTLCDEKNISFQELSNKCGLPEELLNKIKEGKYIPSLEIALKLSDVLSVSVNEIFKM